MKAPTLRSLCLLALALSLAMPVAAAELEVHLLNLEQPTLPPVLSTSLTLAPGGEGRVGPHVLDGARVSLRLSLDWEEAGRASVALHAISERAGARTGWTSRNHVIARGDSARIDVPYSGRYVFQVRLGGGSGVPLSMLVRLTQDGAPVAEQEVEVGSGSTTVLLGEKGEEPLSVSITPRARDLGGAEVDIRCEGRLAGASRDRTPGLRPVTRSGTFTLRWGDMLRIAGLEGPGGPVLLDIIPRP